MCWKALYSAYLQKALRVVAAWMAAKWTKVSIGEVIDTSGKEDPSPVTVVANCVYELLLQPARVCRALTWGIETPQLSSSSISWLTTNQLSFTWAVVASIAFVAFLALTLQKTMTSISL